MKKTYSLKNCDRFSMQQVASKYPSEFRQGHFRDWREKKAIENALKYIPQRAQVLDLPCGTGRLTKTLIQKGFNVSSADRSMEMITIAKKNYKNSPYQLNAQYPRMQYFQEDIIAGTKFKNNEFDAVVCHRLFHHLVDSKTRIQAIRELKRITKGLIIFSFFNSFSLSTIVRLAKNTINRRIPTDRIPISNKKIIAELETLGMEVIKFIPVLFGISPHCIVIADRAQ